MQLSGFVIGGVGTVDLVPVELSNGGVGNCGCRANLGVGVSDGEVGDRCVNLSRVRRVGNAPLLHTADEDVHGVVGHAEGHTRTDDHRARKAAAPRPDAARIEFAESR